jgi:hypothetical protein
VQLPLIFTIWVFRLLPSAFALYTLTVYLVPLCTGYLTSLPRHYLVIFPAGMVTATTATQPTPACQPFFAPATRRSPEACSGWGCAPTAVGDGAWLGPRRSA